MINKPHFIILALFVGTSLLTIGCFEEQQPPLIQTEEDIALELMAHLNNGTIAAAFSTLFTSELQNLSTPAQLEEIWEQITTTYGDFIEISSTRTTEEQGYTIVYVTCTYTDLGVLDTRVVFDDDLLIAGFQFVPTDVSDQYQPPDYADTSLFTEEEILVGAGTEWELPGTLSIPTGDGPYPVVILVHGSGPNDRDETIGPNKPFNDLAWGLASNGIAVLRYEKRTKEHATTIVNQLETFTVYDETIDDAIAAITLCSNYDTIDENAVYILGHSLGGMLAPRIAPLSSQIKGLIMMAAPARPLEDLIHNQISYLAQLDGEITEEEQTQIDLIETQVQQIKTLDFEQGEIIMGAGRAYWEDLASYDQVQSAQQFTGPMLFLQGQRDYQVTYDDDYLTWHEVLTAQLLVTFHDYEALNHLFLEGSGQPTNEEYNTPGNIPEYVITDIVAWMNTD